MPNKIVVSCGEVFVWTGEIRLPLEGEWYAMPQHGHRMMQAQTDHSNNEWPIYAEAPRGAVTFVLDQKFQRTFISLRQHLEGLANGRSYDGEATEIWAQHMLAHLKEIEEAQCHPA